MSFRVAAFRPYVCLKGSRSGECPAIVATCSAFPQIALVSDRVAAINGLRAVAYELYRDGARDPTRSKRLTADRLKSCGMRPTNPAARQALKDSWSLLEGNEAANLRAETASALNLPAAGALPEPTTDPVWYEQALAVEALRQIPDRPQ